MRGAPATRGSSRNWSRTDRPAKPGSIVDVVGIDGEFIGRGFYNGHSRIAVRILETDQNVPVDAGWFSRKDRPGGVAAP